eukprot:10771962-Lingulodinium_polyedra.AAC.1
MGLALGMGEACTLEHLVESDAKALTALPRERILLSTMPAFPGTQLPKRPPPLGLRLGAASATASREMQA